MRVFAYYEPVPGLPRPDKLLDLWRDNWKEYGWEPTIVGESLAREHPNYPTYRDRVATYPTVNFAGYDRACFLRHMAMIHAGGGLLVDYDVINRGFTVEHGEEAWAAAFYGSPHHVLMLERYKVPCAIMASPFGFEQIVGILEHYPVNGDPHVSDNTILSKRDDLASHAWCHEFLGGGNLRETGPEAPWRSSKLIHFSNNSFNKLGQRGEKADLIRQVMRELA